MKPLHKKLIVAGVVVVAIIIAAATLLPGIIARMPREIEGTITWIDADTREASLEYLHPRKGTRKNMTQVMPEDIPITIDEQPAKLEDFHVGDRVLVRFTWDKAAGELNPLAVTLIERGAPTGDVSPPDANSDQPKGTEQ